MHQRLALFDLLLTMAVLLPSRISRLPAALSHSVSGTFSGTPGDPFPKKITGIRNPANLSSAHFASLRVAPRASRRSQANVTLANSTRTFIIDSETIDASPSAASSDTLDRLINIGRWKYTDPKTNQTRYWFHTADSNMGAGWLRDGVAFQAYADRKDETVPVHAFHSESRGVWTNTLQLESMPPSIGNNEWKYDGILAFAFKSSMHSDLLKPVRRYWNKINHGTEDVREPRRALLCLGDVVDCSDLSTTWTADRVLFYAFPPDMDQ